MLLVCPECRTRYVVPDSAIGVDGRQVRCANCRHSWFQDGVAPDAAEDAAPPPAPAPAAAAPKSPPAKERSAEEKPAEDARAAPAASSPSSGADRDRVGKADAPAVAVAADNAAFDEEARARRHRPIPRPRREPISDDLPPPPQFSTMAGARGNDDLPRRARRNPAKYWTAAAVAFAFLVMGIIISNMMFGWIGDTLPYARTDPPLQIIADPDPDRQTIDNGGRETEYFAASGTIVNPTDEEQPVPPLLIVLYDSQGRKVYDWVAKPRVSSLPPGGSVDFNDAQLEVPRSAERMQIFWSE